jgi:hypothetical protein
MSCAVEPTGSSPPPPPSSFFSRALHGEQGAEPPSQLSRKNQQQQQATHAVRRKRPPQQRQRRSECERRSPKVEKHQAVGRKILISASNLKFLNYLGFRVNKSWVEKNN